MVGCVPGAVPAPLQAVQRTAVSTVMSLVTPKTVSSSSSSIGISASRPARMRLRGPRVAGTAEEGVHDVAEAAEPGAAEAAAAAAPPVSNGSPPRSTIRRFSGSVSAS